MSDSSDLFDKADALLGRYRGEARAAAETDFPVLTEVIETLPAPVVTEAAPSLPQGARSDGDLDLLQAQLLEQLQQGLESLIVPAFEAERSRLEDQLSAAVRESIAQARTDIEARLRERLEQAVHDAIARLRGSRS